MPLAWIDNEVYLHHRGITIYMVHRNDDVNQGHLPYDYATSPGASVADDSHAIFDIRDFDPEGAEEAENHPEILRKMIDELFEKGEGSFLFEYLEDGRVPEPDDRKGAGTLHKTTIVVWSRGEEDGLSAAKTIAEAFPDTVALRTGTVEVFHPEADDLWDETCDGKFRG